MTNRDVRPQRTVIVGQGYVGLPLAERCVRAGHDTVGLEIDAERVKRLQNADSYVEDVPSTTLEQMVAAATTSPPTLPMRARHSTPR